VEVELKLEAEAEAKPLLLKAAPPTPPARLVPLHHRQLQLVVALKAAMDNRASSRASSRFKSRASSREGRGGGGGMGSRAIRLRRGRMLSK
jgi:hypothetical protein